MAEKPAPAPAQPAAGGDAAAGHGAAPEGGEAKSSKSGLMTFLPLILMPALCAGAAYGVSVVFLKKIDAMQTGILAKVVGEIPKGDAKTGASKDAAHGDAKKADAHGDAKKADAHGADADSHGAPKAADKGASKGTEKADDPDESVPIVSSDSGGPTAVTVNPKGTSGKRYLVAEIYVKRQAANDTTFKSRVEKKTKQLQEITTRELESYTIEELQKPGTKNMIQGKLLADFNRELSAQGHSSPVGKIIISKWIMQ
ncbi:MAG: flagellar basal body-associated FliL family protein [Pedosphaera sp.]|nr:flagellar basal body-associated FliL family protein [Pedosphaera sp.]MSU43421.1 flagellar basal body-associated FliL family protein [Pedosphaera sp.]